MSGSDLMEPMTETEPVESTEDVRIRKRTNREVDSYTLGELQARIESYDVEDELATERARQLIQDDLEALYGDALDLSNAPDSIGAFEQRATLRRLHGAAIKFGSVEYEEARHPARAKQAIDKMVEYGPIADQFLAGLANNNNVHEHIAGYALESMSGERTDQKDSSVLSAVRSWLTE